MADHDEYEFVDPDAFESSGTEESAAVEAPKVVGMISPPNIKLNALIVVLALIFFIGMYQYIMHRHIPRSDNILQPVQQPVENISNPLQTSNVMPDVVNKAPDQMQQGLNVVQETQQNMQSDLSGMNEHVTRLDDRLSSILTSIEAIGQRVDQLSSTLEVETQRIEHAFTVQKDSLRKKKSSKSHAKKRQIITYNVEAVIPGRAWLIGSNGATITVRVGASIEGYGRVRIIDAVQGRVLTSSGKIMRFSQDDS